MTNHPIHNHPIELESYNPRWPELFEEEAKLLRPIFGLNLITIHHIGSTSIPNISAKPIIDMLPVVKNISIVNEVNSKMEELEYSCLGELGIAGRRFFSKSVSKRTHNVHVFQEGDPNIERHLKFRDILRRDPHLATEYELLKEKLAIRYRHDRKAYTDGKSDFIQMVEKL